MKNRLKQLRQQHDLSQADLARKLSVTRQAINGFESGKFTPSLEMAFKIARLLDVAIEDIFIYEAQNKMETLIKQVSNFFGFEIGFERFTEEAIATVNFALSEAIKTDCTQVEPEHLFKGLLAYPETNSARLLRIDGVKENIELNQPLSKQHKNLKFSSESKFVLELALQIVKVQHKKSIDTEHLLWGLVKLAETNNNVALNKLLQKYEVNLLTLSDRTLEII